MDIVIRLFQCINQEIIFWRHLTVLIFNLGTHSFHISLLEAKNQLLMKNNDWDLPMGESAQSLGNLICQYQESSDKYLICFKNKASQIKDDISWHHVIFSKLVK